MDTLSALTEFFRKDTDANVADYEAVAEACCQRKGDVTFFPVQWLRERLQEQDAELSQRSVFAVRLVEALGNVIEIEPGGIRKGPGVPPPVQRRMAAQVRASDGPLSAFLLRRSPDESWLRHLSPREQAVPGHTDPQDQLRTVKFLLQESRKKVSELHRCVARLNAEAETQAAIISTLQESNDMLELDLAEGREKAPEIQMTLRQLTQSKTAAEDKVSSLQEKLQAYEEYTAERVLELEEEVSKLEAKVSGRAGVKPSFQALFEARTQDWVHERQELERRIEEASSFERRADEDDMVCQCCMERVKRVKMDCGHAMCKGCAENPGVRVCPFCRKALRVAMML